MLKRLLCAAFAVSFLLCLSGVSEAQSSIDVPHVITYQGQLYNGGLAYQGTQTLVMSLYSSETGMVPVWQDSFSVVFTNGMFQVMLGSHNPLPTFNSPLWLGVSLGSGSELQPRVAMGASAYALSIANNSVTADKMAVNYISSIVINGDTLADNGATIALQGWPHRTLFDVINNQIRFGTPQDIDSTSSPAFVDVWLGGYLGFTGTAPDRIVFWDGGVGNRTGFSYFNNSVNLTLSNNVSFNVRNGVYTNDPIFTIQPVTGNTWINGSLDILNNFSINNNVFTVNALSGNTSFLGNLMINNGLFMVDASTGNTIVGGTFNSLGNLFVGNNIFTVNAVTGNTYVGGAFTSIGNVTIGNNVFNINASSGNTTLLGNLSINNGIWNVNASTGNTYVGGTLTSIGNFVVNNNAFVVNALTGNTVVGGTFNSIGNLVVGNNFFTVNALTGNTIVGGTFNSVGNFSIGNNIFNINALTGNTYVGGSLTSIGNFTVGNNLFNINTVNNTLSMIGNVNINNGLFNISNTNSTITLGGTVNMTGNVSLANNFFNINASTGNAYFSSVLNLSNNLVINNGINTYFSVNGSNGNTSILGTLLLGGAATFSGALNMTNHAITNLATPVNSTDAATKAYVDSKVGTAGGVFSTASISSGGTIPGDAVFYNVLDDATSNPATANLPTTAQNGQLMLVTTDDKQGLTINGTTIKQYQLVIFAYFNGWRMNS